MLKEKEVTLEEITEFAHKQLGSENPAVTVYHDGYDISDPWYTFGPEGKYLTNEEAIKEWGEELMEKFIKKAKAYLEAAKILKKDKHES